MRQFKIYVFCLLLSFTYTSTYSQDFKLWIDDQNTQAVKTRMAEANVNGMAIAVIRNNKIDTFLYFGNATPELNERVEEETLFAAGSLSSMLTAVAILQAVESGKINLDGDINQYLTSWQLPKNKFSIENPVTVQDLLTKRRGFTQYSKPEGYAAGEDIPSLQQILNGSKPAKNKAIKLRSNTKNQDNYSFETEVILQQILEDVYKESFDKIIKTNILDPLGMKNSYVAIKLPEEAYGQLATGFTIKGEKVKGKYWRQPELGSAGLYTTVSDYAKLVIDLLKASQGFESKVLKTATIQKALIPLHNSKALIGNANDNGGNRFYGGAPMGFRTQYTFNPDKKWGLVVFMNSHENWRFMNEVMRSLTRFYNL